jgi:hypothetical protein
VGSGNASLKNRYFENSSAAEQEMKLLHEVLARL